MITGMRTCPGCGISKSLDDFHRCKGSKTGRDVYCKTCKKRRHHEHYEQNKKHYNEVSTRWQQAHPEHRQKQYRKHKESYLEVRKKWYQDNKEKQRESLREWRRNNPDKRAAQNYKSRAARAGVTVNTLTSKEWSLIKAAYGGKCAYCGKKTRLTQDHITPISKGGNHDVSNVVPACGSCNSKKGTGPVLVPIQPMLIV